MSKSTKVIAALGVAAGLGVAALPAATFAVQADQTQDVVLTLTIDDAFELSVDANSKDAGTLAAGATSDTLATTATVKSNLSKGYTLSVKANGTVTDKQTSLVNSNGDEIKAFGTAQTTLANTTPGWGAKLGDSYTGNSGLTTNSYTGLTTAGTQVVTTNSAPTTSPTTTGDQYVVNYGIALATNQPSGTYTGKATYTLHANE